MNAESSDSGNAETQPSNLEDAEPERPYKFVVHWNELLGEEYGPPDGPAAVPSANGEDRISDLPESLLLRILSRLGSTKFAVRTSVLSRRWCHLYKQNPNIWFNDTDFESSREFVETLSVFLMNHQAQKLERFSVTMTYHGRLQARYVDSWARFLARHGVEELLLDLEPNSCGRSYEEEHYPVQSYFYLDFKHLRKLKLNLCILNPPPTVNFHLLKDLELAHIDICEEEFRILMAGCPVLEDLVLHKCNMMSDLHVAAPNKLLKRLQINDFVDEDDEFDSNLVYENSSLIIYAPNLRSLEIVGCIRSCYVIKDLSSLVSANLEFDEHLCGYLNEHDDRKRLLGLMEDLQHVKHLSLTRCCVEAFSFSTIFQCELPSLKVASLKLYTGFSKWELIGVVNLLVSSPSLKTLYIVDSSEVTSHDLDTLAVFEFDSNQHLKSMEPIFSAQSEHLKIIEMEGTLRWAAPYFYREHNDRDKGDFSQEQENQVWFMGFLLRCCKTLDNLIFGPKKKPLCLPRYEIEPELKTIARLADMVLAFPRLSFNAKVVIL